MVSLQSDWASSEPRLSCLPMTPMIQPMTGTKRMVNSVSCQLIKSRVPK